MDTISSLFKILNLGNIIEIKKVDSSQNIVVEVITDQDKYILKQYSKDAIKNENDLIKRIKQLTVSEILNEKGISTILPLKFANNYFVYYQNNYYLIYKYFDYQILNDKDVTLKHIEILARTMAKMHKLNLKSDLPCQYRKINIDYDNQLKVFKNIDDKLYECLKNNLDKLKKLTHNCNNNIERVSDILCISHNDYKLKNILWNDEKMYLIDFDACALSNPYVSLAEAAFALSKQGKMINLDYYQAYLTNYLEIYQNENINYQDALMVAMNGKLQWLEYLFSKCEKTDKNGIDGAISMMHELVLFSDHQDRFYELFLN